MNNPFFSINREEGMQASTTHSKSEQLSKLMLRTLKEGAQREFEQDNQTPALNQRVVNSIFQSGS